ncbi:30S ribosomal protein S18 [Candidatus Peregrinibacteria bacterium]|nr:MAG: 30S ribosomal protein S18 [Candidatus Peregrinibacteria bacterium]
MFQKKKCFFCQQKMKHIDYKNASLLHLYLDYFNSIKRREHTGTCLRHQKILSCSIKRARHLALCGFVR